MPDHPLWRLQMLDRIASPTQEWHASIQFTYWLQWHLHRQLLQASQYAAGRHVALKGDLPIGEAVGLGVAQARAGGSRRAGAGGAEAAGVQAC